MTRSPAPQLQRRGLDEDLAEALRQSILKGSLAPGTRLTELELAASWQVSQGTVRAALKTLTTEGLVENRPRRGSFVTSISQADVLEIYTLRDSLEALAARRAAHRVNKDNRAELERVLSAMRQAALSGQRKRLLDLDFEFHRTVVAMADHRRLMEIYARLESQTRLFLNMTDRYHHDLEALFHLHEPLATAILEGDEDRAFELASHHSENDGKALAAQIFASPVAKDKNIA